MSGFVESRIALVIFAIGLTSCGKSGQTSGSSSVDHELIAAVRAAASSGVAPVAVESHVPAKALINTVRPGDRDKSLFGQMELDPDQSSEVSNLDSKDLAYWRRPGRWVDPHVVGIVWLPDGSEKVFFAILYPPG